MGHSMVRVSGNRNVIIMDMTFREGVENILTGVGVSLLVLLSVITDLRHYEYLHSQETH